MFERLNRSAEDCIIFVTASAVDATVAVFERVDNALSLATVSWTFFVRGYLDGFVENMYERDRAEFIKATGPWTSGKYNGNKEVKI